MRSPLVSFLFAGALLSLGWLGCAGDSATGTYTPTTTDAGTGGSAPTDLGVGESCHGDAECRSGLSCPDGSCQPGHELAAGQPCIINDECQIGLYCGDGKCATAGAGTDGDYCATDAQCQSGFRCSLGGLGASCVPEGSVDVGGSCSQSEDCFGGLGCVAGVCGVLPPGTPPFGSQWSGIDCPQESGPVQAYFRIPRGADDGDFYRLPMPNDVRLKGGKIDLSGHPTPGADLLGYDLVDRYLRAAEQGTDGWGVHHAVFFRFSGLINADTLSGNVKLVSLTGDHDLGYFYRYESSRTNYMCPNRFVVGALPGVIFNPGESYAAYLTTGTKAEDNSDIVRSDDLVALLGDTLPAEAVLAAEWPKYAAFRAYLAAHSIDPASILNAAVFTVGHPRDMLERLAAVTAAATAPTTTSWTRCDTAVASPCPDATGERACAAADADFDELHALVTLPIYQVGTAPYLTPADGGNIGTDNAGNPAPARTEQVCLSLTVPKGMAPGAGWPTLVFAHGTSGSFRSHVTLGLSHDFAVGVDDGSGTLVRAAVLGIDQVGHGPRRNGSTLEPQTIVYNYANPAAARGNIEQGAADQMAILRLVPTIAFDASSSPTGVAFALGAPIALWGHSQGASFGSMALPYGDWAGAVLSGQGASLRNALVTKTSPVDIAAVLPWVIGDASPGEGLRGGANHPVLSWLQTYMDAADPIAYGALAVRHAPTGMSAHHVFQPYGLSDTYSPGVTQGIYAASAGLHLAEPDPSVSTADDIGYPALAPQPLPLSGNVTVDGKTVTAVVREYAPAAGADGHTIAFDLPSARADAERFLAGVLADQMPQVGP